MTGYVRGAGSKAMRPGRAAAVLMAGAAAALGTACAALAVSAASRNATLDELSHRGVAVEAVVTGCIATSSGIGMSVEYWTCRGSYILQGRRFDEVVHGERRLVQPGRAIEAIAVPGHPSLLSTPAAAHQAPEGYTLSEGCGAAALVVAGGGLAAGRAGRRS
jgi:hypothetical protein